MPSTPMVQYSKVQVATRSATPHGIFLDQHPCFQCATLVSSMGQGALVHIKENVIWTRFKVRDIIVCCSAHISILVNAWTYYNFRAFRDHIEEGSGSRLGLRLHVIYTITQYLVLEYERL